MPGYRRRADLSFRWRRKSRPDDLVRARQRVESGERSSSVERYPTWSSDGALQSHYLGR